MSRYEQDWVAADPSAILSPVLLSIAAYNTVELLIWIFNTFPRRRGLYFSSILTATLSLMGYLFACFLKLFEAGGDLLGGTIWAISYATLLPAHILVLYSRLHLLLPHNPRLLRCILLMIITTAALTVPAQLIIAIFSATGDTRFAMAEFIIERIAFMGGSLREFILCAVYMTQAFKQLQPIVLAKGRAGRKVMVDLIVVQIVVILLDIGFIVLMCLNLSELETGYGAVLFSVKLKLEFAILNALVRLLRSPMVLLPSSLGVASANHTNNIGNP
ncbi:hypothetical protein BDW59DRAFT_178734 [Aspergillus cavernicola]|uniref:DUF7703 domain-containing protein n=1 Tax=Aspergillus cavernicola TaxID=176166 RepID=A0ABR4J2G1_9EURO